MKFIALNHRETFDEPYIELNVTSQSKDWGKALSPFILGPVTTINGTAMNVENAYQYSKVYDYHWDEEKQRPRDNYWAWRQKGFDSMRADRYPMGKENVHRVVGLWIGRQDEPGELLTYVEGRKRMYVPTYLQGLRNSRFYPTFLKFIADAYHTDTNLVFRDFDVFNHYKAKRTLIDILNDPGKKYGHGFILIDEALRFLLSHEEDLSNFELKLDGSSMSPTSGANGSIDSQVARGTSQTPL